MYSDQLNARRALHGNPAKPGQGPALSADTARVPERGVATLKHWGRLVIATVAATLLAAIPPTASASPSAPPKSGGPGRYQQLIVPSAMGPITVDVQWAVRGGSAALYLLDGMRARADRNGWELNTDALTQFADDNITVVMPVGGAASFYTDWATSLHTGDRDLTYRWETFLTTTLPEYLARFGISRRSNAVLGLSMSGSAALALAAYHRGQFTFAGSLSGFLDLTAPGMGAAIDLAMADVGPQYRSEAMWGPWPIGSAWQRNDPSTFAPRLRGLSLFVASGNGVPGALDRLNSAQGVLASAAGAGLELLARINSEAFHTRMLNLRIPVTWDFTAGSHEWGYWQSELARAHRQILEATGTQ